MNSGRSLACLGAGVLLAAVPAHAGKGLGELYNLKYDSAGIAGTYQSSDGRVSMTIEDIYTINCGGCDVVWYGPGSIFHLRNLGKSPVCASLVFTPTSDAYGLYRWGSGQVFYLKGRKEAKKAAGLYTVSSGEDRTVNLGITYEIKTWEPTGKKSCGTAPY